MLRLYLLYSVRVNIRTRNSTIFRQNWIIEGVPNIADVRIFRRKLKVILSNGR